MAVIQRCLGNFVDAVSMHEEATELYQKLLGPDHPYTLNVLGNLGISMKHNGSLDTGDQMIRGSLDELLKKKFPRTHPWVKKFEAELETNSEDYYSKASSYDVGRLSGSSRGQVPRNRAVSRGASNLSVPGRRPVFHHAESMDSAYSITTPTHPSYDGRISITQVHPVALGGKKTMPPLPPHPTVTSAPLKIQEPEAAMLHYTSASIVPPFPSSSRSIDPVVSDPEDRMRRISLESDDGAFTNTKAKSISDMERILRSSITSPKSSQDISALGFAPEEELFKGGRTLPPPHSSLPSPPPPASARPAPPLPPPPPSLRSSMTSQPQSNSKGDLSSDNEDRNSLVSDEEASSISSRSTESSFVRARSKFDGKK